MIDLIAAAFDFTDGRGRVHLPWPLIAGVLISAIVCSALRVWARRRGAPVRAHTPPADLPEKRQSTKERAPGGQCRNSLNHPPRAVQSLCCGCPVFCRKTLTSSP